VNALQCLPVGRLDGGRVATATLGQSTAGFLSGLTLTLLGLSTLFSADNPILLFWGLTIIFLQRSPDLPCADDLTEVDAMRQTVAAVAALITLATLLPCPVTIPVPVDGSALLPF